MGSPQYIRNYVSTSRIKVGTPIRSVFLDNPNDLIVKSFVLGQLTFENDSRQVQVIKGEPSLRFPYRTPEEGGQIRWDFAPFVSDLAANDVLNYLGDPIVIHDIYRRPGEDWVRLSVKPVKAPGGPRGAGITRTWCMLNDVATFDTVFNGTRDWKEFPIEVAGPYLRHTENEMCRFFVSPLSRGYTWRIGLPGKGPERVASSSGEVRTWFGFCGEYNTERHPNDGNAHFSRRPKPRE